ncbi:MAG: histidine phosphatase family protein [Chloroflexota bacterium]
MRLILVRHGQTDCNVRDIWHAWDGCGLTAAGREQARKLASRLADETIDAVYSSDSPRAVQTATILAEPHGLVPIQRPDLRERNIGDFEGLLAHQIEARNPNVWSERDADLWGWTPPGGENFKSVLTRSLEAVRELREQDDCRTVVLVSHMGVTRVLICYLGGLSIQETYAMQFPSTGVSIFELDGDSVAVTALNDAGHMTAPQR